MSQEQRRRLTTCHVPGDNFVMEGNTRIARFERADHAERFVQAVDYAESGTDLEATNGAVFTKVPTAVAGMHYIVDVTRHSVAIFKAEADADLFIQIMKPQES